MEPPHEVQNPKGLRYQEKWIINLWPLACGRDEESCCLSRDLKKNKPFPPKKILKPLLSVGLVTAFTLSARHRIMETGMHIKPRPEIGELVNAYTFPQLHVLGTRPESNSCQRGAHNTNHVKK